MSENANSAGKFDVALFKRVLHYAQPYRKQLWLSITLSILLAAFAPIRPTLIQQTIDEYVKNDLTRMVVLVTIIQIALLLVETAMRFLFNFTTAKLGQAVVLDMRKEVYHKVLHLNLRQFDKTPIGMLTTRTVDDMERINEIFADGLIPIIADLLSIVCVLAYMFYQDWQLALLCLIPFPFILIATWIFKESVNKSFHKVRNAVANLNAFVQEHLTGMQVVQSFAAEERELGKFQAINKEHRNANIQAIFAYSVFFPVVEIVLAVAIGIIVWWGGHYKVDPGTLISFILCLNLIFRPLRVIADKFNVIQMGMVAAERVMKLMDNDDFIQHQGTIERQSVAGKVTFEQVNFGYVPEKLVIKNLSFTIPSGQTLAVVGHTGSGKTTLVSLLNRLYQIQSGSIKIDDTPIEAFTVANLRSHIGVVLQDVFLFSGTVLENLTLGNPNVSEAAAIRAAQLVGVHDFIMQLPGGYHHQVKERGGTMSLGQRQLMSFARALLYNPSVLILDEATSSVDAESEQMIQHAIDTLIAGRTAIIIAHRLSTIRKADQILVMEKGELKEIGSHEILMQQNGYYKKLYDLQFAKHPVV